MYNIFPILDLKSLTLQEAHPELVLLKAAAPKGQSPGPGGSLTSGLLLFCREFKIIETAPPFARILVILPETAATISPDCCNLSVDWPSIINMTSDGVSHGELLSKALLVEVQ